MGTTRRNFKPKPGIYPSIPFDVYKAWPYVNNSSLDPALKSGRHYELAQHNGAEKRTKSLDFGSLVNCLLLEPALFDEQFAIEPDFESQLKYPYKSPRSSPEYKNLVADWKKANRGKTLLSWADYDRGCMASDSLRAAFGPLLGDAMVEASVVSDCPETGLRLKSRLDLLLAEMIIDVKTTIRGDSFEYEIRRWGYHRQGAFYQDIVAPHRGGAVLPYWLAVVDSEPPYLVQLAPLADEALQEGRRDMMRALRRIARGQRGEWSGYPHRICWRLPDDRTIDVIGKGKHLEL